MNPFKIMGDPPYMKNVLKSMEHYKLIFEHQIQKWQIGIPNLLFHGDDPIDSVTFFKYIVDNIIVPTEAKAIRYAKTARRYGTTVLSTSSDNIIKLLNTPSPSYDSLYSETQNIITYSYLDVIQTLVTRQNAQQKEISDDEDKRFNYFRKVQEAIDLLEIYNKHHQLPVIQLYKNIGIELNPHVSTFIVEATHKAITNYDLTFQRPTLQETSTPTLTPPATSPSAAGNTTNTAELAQSVSTPPSLMGGGGTNQVSPASLHTVSSASPLPLGQGHNITPLPSAPGGANKEGYEPSKNTQTTVAQPPPAYTSTEAHGATAAAQQTAAAQKHFAQNAPLRNASTINAAATSPSTSGHIHQQQASSMQHQQAPFPHQQQASFTLQPQIPFTTQPRAPFQQQQQAPFPQQQQATHTNQQQSISISITDPRDHQIPPFSGRYDQWEHFYNLFLNLIHNDPTTTNSTKMHRLIRALRGPALQLVKHLELSEENYQRMVDILRNAYGQPEAVCTKMMNTISNFQIISHTNGPEFNHFVSLLRQLYIHMQKYFPESISAPLPLLMHIYPILPRTLLTKWQLERAKLIETYGKEQITPFLLDKFVSFLEQEKNTNDAVNLTLETSSRTQPKQSYNSHSYQAFHIQTTKPPSHTPKIQTQPPTRPPFKFSSNQRTQQFSPQYRPPLPSSQQRNQSQNRPMSVSQRPGTPQPQKRVTFTNQPSDNACILCNKNNHVARNCKMLMPPTQVMDIVKKHGLCINCLMRGHGTNACKQPSHCGRGGCKLKHHRRLHGMPRLVKRPLKPQ